MSRHSTISRLPLMVFAVAAGIALGAASLGSATFAGIGVASWAAASCTGSTRSPQPAASHTPSAALPPTMLDARDEITRSREMVRMCD